MISYCGSSTSNELVLLMTHSYSKLLFHLIRSTKNREKFISEDIKNRLYSYIRRVICDKEQALLAINGMSDHVHLLVSLSTTICVSDFIRTALPRVAALP